MNLWLLDVGLYFLYINRFNSDCTVAKQTLIRTSVLSKNCKTIVALVSPYPGYS